VAQRCHRDCAPAIEDAEYRNIHIFLPGPEPAVVCSRLGSMTVAARRETDISPARLDTVTSELAVHHPLQLQMDTN